MTKIIISSKNPVKVNATLLGFQQMFPEQSFEAEGVEVNSEINQQPMSETETIQGVINRIKNSKNLKPEADFWVGIEGGLEEKKEGIQSFSWIFIESKDGIIGKAKTNTYYLPDKLSGLIKQGYNLGEAADIIFKQINTKEKGGTIGILTDNLIDRTKVYIDAVILALIPFKKKELY